MPGTSRQTNTRELTLGGRIPAYVAIVVAASALGLGYLAHLHGRPVTAALLAVLSVTAIGALLGLRAGVLSGVAASVAYNLLFTDPYLRFSVASADDLVPIIALNVSAIGSGLIAGRLRDRAVAAEASNRRIAELLKFSQDLQRALSLEQIQCVLAEFLQANTGKVRVTLKGPEQGWNSPSSESAGGRNDDSVGRTHFLLESRDRPVGELTIDHEAGAFHETLVQPFLPIVAMATERCILATEAVEADLIRRSEKFKTALLSSVSHDLRTPLAAISASASTLASLGAQLEDAIRRDLLKTIQDECEKLDRLTRNLLNLGRIEGGLDVERMPQVDAIEVLGTVLARMRASSPSHRFERDFRTADARIRADEILLEQLFSNVLENAVVHTPAGTVVRVAAAPSGDTLTVTVEDDGPGIPDADSNRVFHRFYQAGAGGPRRGSGLGLSIARGFVEAIGGGIRAAPAVAFARGTRIDISLPLAGRQ